MKPIACVSFVCAAALICGATCIPALRAQAATDLKTVDAPAHGVWVDGLDLSKAAIRRPMPVRGGRGTTPPPGPPPPLKFVLGGAEYPHAVPLQVDNDLMIDLKGQAARFESMVGVDDGV